MKIKLSAEKGEISKFKLQLLKDGEISAKYEFDIGKLDRLSNTAFNGFIESLNIALLKVLENNG